MTDEKQQAECDVQENDERFVRDARAFLNRFSWSGVESEKILPLCSITREAIDRVEQLQRALRYSEACARRNETKARYEVEVLQKENAMLRMKNETVELRRKLDASAPQPPRMIALPGGMVIRADAIACAYKQPYQGSIFGVYVQVEGRGLDILCSSERERDSVFELVCAAMRAA